MHSPSNIKLVLFNGLKPKVFNLSAPQIVRWYGSLWIFIALLFCLFSWVLKLGWEQWTVQSQKHQLETVTQENSKLMSELSILKNEMEALQNISSGKTPQTLGMHPQTLLPLSSISLALPAVETLSFKVAPMELLFQKDSLSLQSSIEYLKPDGGNQQGHFIIVGSGAGKIWVHPTTALNFNTQQDALLNPALGEYFSVSRFREIRVLFDGLKKSDDIQWIRLYLFRPDNRLIYKQEVKR